jgi:hypothetical protein
MTDDDFPGPVLAFPETTEGRHGELPTFHMRGRHFATLGWPEPYKVSIALSLEEQERHAQMLSSGDRMPFRYRVQKYE